MTKPKLDKSSPSLTPHGDILKVPGGKAENGKSADKPVPESSRPPVGPGPGIPGQPSQPAPRPEPTDVPGETPEPEEPGQGQPIPPELASATRR